MPIDPFTQLEIGDSLDVGRGKINSHLDFLRTNFNGLEGDLGTLLSGDGTLSSGSASRGKVLTADGWGSSTWNNPDAVALSNTFVNKEISRRGVSTYTSSLNATTNPISFKFTPTRNMLISGAFFAYSSDGSPVGEAYIRDTNAVALTPSASVVNPTVSRDGHSFWTELSWATPYQLTSGTEYIISFHRSDTNTDFKHVPYGTEVSHLDLNIVNNVYISYNANVVLGAGYPGLVFVENVEQQKGVIGQVEIDAIPLLDEFSVTTTTQQITTGSFFQWYIDIPVNRLYGVSIAVNGLTTGQSSSIRLFGDSALSDEQYLAGFTSASSLDDAQAWRYRDREKTKTLRIQAENTGADTINISVSIEAEPFY